MTDEIEKPYINPHSKAVGRVVNHIKKLYAYEITEEEAQEAAFNLINYVQILLEFQRKAK